MSNTEFNLGEYQTLKAVKKTDFGYFLGNDDTEATILLPKKECPDTLETGDNIEVFIYKDSDDRPVATTLKPLITLTEVKRLRVKQVTRIGAFLDWGLLKDLLLPFHEQIYKVSEGDMVLVKLYIDKSERLCASMHVYDSLSTNSPYHEGDEVSGTVYELSDNFGVFVAIDDTYSALIPKKDVFEEYHINQKINARISKVLEDGKLTLATKKKIPEQMACDAKTIHEALKSAKNGFIPLNDKSSPDDIKRTFHMSKASFKRAIGNLYKAKLIKIESDGIHLSEDKIQ